MRLEKLSDDKITNLLSRERILRKRVLAAELAPEKGDELEAELSMIERLLKQLGYRRIG